MDPIDSTTWLILFMKNYGSLQFCNLQEVGVYLQQNAESYDCVNKCFSYSLFYILIESAMHRGDVYIYYLYTICL